MTNKEILAQAEKAMQLRNYSRKTIKAYCKYVKGTGVLTHIKGIG